jgi:hypothetical protein
LIKFRRWKKKYKNLFTSKKYILDLLVSVFFFVFVTGFFFKGYLKYYLKTLDYNPVNDELLNMLPDINLDIIASQYIFVIVLLFLGYTIFFKLEKLPFYIKTITLLYTAKFIILPTTNLTYPAGAIHESFDTIYNDLFFSGHTAFPVLLYFITKDDAKSLRWFFLFSAFVEGITVLLMNLHYTIDVYAAPFFAYGVYHIAKNIFRHNYKEYDELIGDDLIHA